MTIININKIVKAPGGSLHIPLTLYTRLLKLLLTHNPHTLQLFSYPSKDHYISHYQ